MKIITAVVNNPVFIELQYYTLQKYFKGEYEFIVFNDAKDFADYTNGYDITIKAQIEDMCRKLNIQCINIPNNHHKMQTAGSIRTAESMNYILNYQIQNPDKYLVLDSDMFLIDYFDINKYSSYDCAIVLQSRNLHDGTAYYFWNGIYYFDMSRLKNVEMLNWNCCDGCDTGGMMQQWLKTQFGNNNSIMPNTDDIRWKKNMQFHTDTIYFIKHLWSCTWDVTEIPKNIQDNPSLSKLLDFIKNDTRNVNGKFFCEIYDNVFLHYRAGSNWQNEGLGFHKKITQLLKESLLSD